MSAVVAEGVDLGQPEMLLQQTHRGQRPRLQHQRGAAKTDSGSQPETLPAASQPNRLMSAPIKNEIAANGTKPRIRRTSASGPLKISPLRISQPALCSCSARSAAPCLSIVSQMKSSVSTAAAKNPIAFSGAILWPSSSSNAAADPNPAVPK